MQENRILITTSSNIEGAEIIDYLEPVTAHLVIGMNFFKDVFSGLTDFFGGNSSSYQNTLNRINNEAIQLLKTKAKEKGANCVIDLKIDNDEISAQSKSMLMVTAIGMAVKITSNKRTTESNTYDAISSDLLKSIVLKNKYSESSAIVPNNIKKKMKPQIICIYLNNILFYAFLHQNTYNIRGRRH